MSRTVVVSGGGTGIGRAIARTFALGGDRVAIVSRRADVVERTAGELNREAGAETVRAYPADLSIADQVQRVADAILSGHDGALDVVVNNAGGADRAPAETLADLADSWERDLRANLRTAMLLTTALLPALRRPGGRVVSISSIAALRGGGDSYSASKAALIGWTFALARDLGPEGITANVVAPGYVTETEFFADTMTGERHRRLVAETMMGRPGLPEDVAAAVRYLASPEAGFVTAQVLQVNGGALVGR